MDLGPFGLAALRRQSTPQAPQRRRREGVYSDRNLVFANALGRPLQVSTMHRWDNAAFERPGLPFSACVRLSRGSLRAIPNSLGSTGPPVGRPNWGNRDPRKPTTPQFDAFRSGATGGCHSAGSEILGKNEVSGSIPDVGSRHDLQVWEDSSAAGVVATGPAEALHHTITMKTLWCGVCSPNRLTHAPPRARPTQIRTISRPGRRVLPRRTPPSPYGDVANLAASWRRTLAAENKPPSTLDTYLRSVRQFMEFLDAQGMPRDIEAVGREHSEAFVQDQLDRHSASTANTRYRRRQRFFGWAEGEIEISSMRRTRHSKFEEACRTASRPTICAGCWTPVAAARSRRGGILRSCCCTQHAAATIRSVRGLRRRC